MDRVGSGVSRARAFRSGPRQPLRRVWGGLLAILVAGLANERPRAASAQSLNESYDHIRGVAELAVLCEEAGGVRAACRELSLAAMAVQRGAGLSSAPGSDIPGTSSTHGRRLGLTPRIGISLSGSALRFDLPTLSGTTAALAERDRATLAGLRVTAVAGLLNGVGFGPGVGGVGSLDLIASWSMTRFPEEKALSASRTFLGGSALGAGVRVGILRESFTLPGISVAATRQWHAGIGFGNDQTPGGGATELIVSSLRATAGKNWFVIGFMGGIGWDRYEGLASLRLAPGIDVSGNVASERLLYFASGWFNFLVTRLSVEVGWAEGNRDPFQGRSAAFDPGERTWFGSAILRVTL